MKMITSCPNSACKADLGLFPTLGKFSKSGNTKQFARSILNAPYLSIQANLALAPVDNVLELS